MNLKLIALIAWFSCSLVFSIQAQEPVPNKTSGSIAGRITVDGKPKAGLVVELLATDTNGPRRPIAKAITTKSGKYVLTNVASGTYDVSPTTPTFVVPNQGSSGQSGRSVTIEPGETIKGIDFDLIRVEDSDAFRLNRDGYRHNRGKHRSSCCGGAVQSDDLRPHFV